jgi:hypothetical protein
VQGSRIIAQCGYKPIMAVTTAGVDAHGIMVNVSEVGVYDRIKVARIRYMNLMALFRDLRSTFFRPPTNP